MKKIYSKKHSHIKKQFIAQKFLHLLGENEYVLFLHHSGASHSSWQKLKEQIECNKKLHSLLLPSKISRYTCFQNTKCTALPPSETSEQGGEKAKADPAFSRDQKEIYIQGGALLVACSSLSQCCAVLEKCSPPDLFCIGGCFPGMPFSSHLDVQRWVELYKNREGVYKLLLGQLVQWQRLFLLPNAPLNYLQRLTLIPWTNWLLKKKLLSLLESERSRKECNETGVSTVAR